jgi:hypothetical protein
MRGRQPAKADFPLRCWLLQARARREFGMFVDRFSIDYAMMRVAHQRQVANVSARRGEPTGSPAAATFIPG